MNQPIYSNGVMDGVPMLDVDLQKSKGRRQNSLPLTTNFSQNVSEPSKGISYPVGDLCQRLKKMIGSSAYRLHSNLIPQTDGTNDKVTCRIHFTNQCFPACFCHHTVGICYVSPKLHVLVLSYFHINVCNIFIIIYMQKNSCQ